MNFDGNGLNFDVTFTFYYILINVACGKFGRYSLLIHNICK